MIDPANGGHFVKFALWAQTSELEYFFIFYIKKVAKMIHRHPVDVLLLQCS